MDKTIEVNKMKHNQIPVLFSPEMVKAILDGKKTQTRRVVKPSLSVRFDTEKGGTLAWKTVENSDGQLVPIVDFSPCGQVGDTLYVRERWNAQNGAGQWWHEVPRDERELHDWVVTAFIGPSLDETPPR